jgi:hypothetical protein
MVDAEQKPRYTNDDPHEAPIRHEPTTWVGSVRFGGIMMLVMGSCQAIGGLVALLKKDYYLVSANSLMVDIDYLAWDWTHLLIGLVAVIAGIENLLGQMLARVVGNHHRRTRRVGEPRLPAGLSRLGRDRHRDLPPADLRPCGARARGQVLVLPFGRAARDRATCGSFGRRGCHDR